jgi:uncharacterized glyoxalase superfamily protein PhnB
MEVDIMSAAAPTLYPTLRYRNAPAAIEFLKAAFGFQERVVYPNPDGTIAHAELIYGTGMVMLGSEKDDMYKDNMRPGSSSIYVAVDDTDAHYARAKAAAAQIITELHDTDYGSREYAARDLEGNIWSFGTYRPAAEPVKETATTH